jgi:Ca2+-binding EF-hand superfamily protein
MLCIDYPGDILSGILKILDKREEETVEFDEFLCGIRTILLYDNYFEELEQLFKYLDV